MKRFVLPFRIGLKQNRAVLDSQGKEIVLFPKGCEYLALQFVEAINDDLRDYNPGKVAKLYKVPVGNITCPHCETTCSGIIKMICPICDKNYFEKYE